MKTKECRGCGQEFTVPRGGPVEFARRLYCSRRCAVDAQSAGLPTVKTCKHCGDEFHKPVGRGAGQWAIRQFCSSVCSNEYRGTEARQRLVEDVAWIVDHDHPHSVAKRVGYSSVDDLVNKLGRIGHQPLAEKLVRNLERWRGGAEVA